MRNPRLYPHLSDDHYPPAAEFWPNSDPSIHYMVAYDSEIMGLYFTHPINLVLWEIHHAILPRHWGRTDEIAEAFEDWVWSETPAETLIGFTPHSNRLALRYAKRRGMVESGLIPRGYLKGGKLHDITVFTKHKPIKI